MIFPYLISMNLSNMLMPANFTQSLWTLCELSTDTLGFFPTCWKCGSVQSLSRVQLFATLWTAACQASLSITISRSLCPNSCPLSWWCHPTISSSVIPFSSCLQSCSASGSFQMSHFFASGGQSIGVSASASVLPVNIQDWFPLGWTSWISLLAYISIVTAHRLFIWNLTVNKVFPSCTLTIPTIALWNISTLIYRNKI